MLFVASNALATVSVKRSIEKPKTIDVAIENEPLSSAVKAIAMYLPRHVQLVVSDEPNVTYNAKQIAPEDALRGVVAAGGATLALEKNQFWVRNDRDPKVTLDVKDEDIRVIFATMKRQCGVKNLVIDPDVEGKGTFLFDGVPCKTAFSIVFRTMGLASVDYGNSVVTVGTRHH